VVVRAVIGSTGRTATEETVGTKETEACAPFNCLVLFIRGWDGRQSLACIYVYSVIKGAFYFPICFGFGRHIRRAHLKAASRTCSDTAHLCDSYFCSFWGIFIPKKDNWIVLH
jgi:hypothetical protein